MVATEITLINRTLTTNSIGVQVETTTQKVVPIIKIEDIYAREFYEAGERGFKPDLRLRISLLNYEDEEELIYMNKTYTVIRKQDISFDEVILVCERKIKNG